MTPDDILTPAKVAAVLGLHVNTVHRWLARGLLPGRKVGGRWFVSAPALQAFLDAPGAAPTPARADTPVERGDGRPDRLQRSSARPVRPRSPAPVVDDRWLVPPVVH